MILGELDYLEGGHPWVAYANLERSGDNFQTHHLPIGNLTLQKPNLFCYQSRLENAHT